MQQQVGEQNLSLCFQCAKCSLGCSVAFAMDFLPHQVVRLAEKEEYERLFQSNSIWICTGCEICKSRCPNNIDVGALNDFLKAEALRKKAARTKVGAFHSAFLDTLNTFGRLHELWMMVLFMLKSRTMTKDFVLGIKMFFKGTLKILPSPVKGRKEIKAIFDYAKERA
jgi:heterodisulfide reductase subunit C